MAARNRKRGSVESSIAARGESESAQLLGALIDDALGTDESESAPVESAPVESAPVESAPVESAPVESAPVESAPVESAPVDYEGMAAFDGTDGWPLTADFGGVAYAFQTSAKVAKGAAFYTSDANGNGLYGTGDAAQTRTDAAHRKMDTAPVVAYTVAVLGGGPVAGPDGILSGAWSPRSSDRVGTPRIIPVCKCHNRAILA